ncbi:hypothetical protein [Pandoravirus japonicus]|uniref:Uncharacterized protein n=1 Tax=Pandoravirus japonicus TaxID=2823154 RepID=A0A811BSU1_9VIRU|nr:hypothetical protein [Pandoravirus japonicus]
MEAARPSVASPKIVRARAHRHADVVLALSLDVRGGRVPRGCFFPCFFPEKKLRLGSWRVPFVAAARSFPPAPVAAVGKKRRTAKKKKRKRTAQEGDRKRKEEKGANTLFFHLSGAAACDGPRLSPAGRSRDSCCLFGSTVHSGLSDRCAPATGT